MRLPNPILCPDHHHTGWRYQRQSYTTPRPLVNTQTIRPAFISSRAAQVTGIGVTRLMPCYDAVMPGSTPEPIALQPNEETTGAHRARQRAPRRTGRRAQLTVPEQVWSEIVDIADAAGTTPNDILVRLAAERLEDRRRSIELSRRAQERWRGFLDAAPTPGAAVVPLGEQELIELSETLRAEP
jgi:hypothetical protein